ncbi:MAG: histidine kinase [Taibaiella sp.]|nr:histidine kinase [Taibaiella sp.]
MVLPTNKWKSFFSSRLAKNIYFWLFTLLFIYKLNSGVDKYPQSVYLMYKGVLAGLLMVLTYVNNLILVPKLLATKKHIWYALTATTLLLIISTGFVTVFKHMLSRYPLAEIYEVSIITMPVGPDWTTEALTEEIIGYAFGLALWLGAFTMAWYMQDHSRQEKKAKEAAHKQTEAELELLRNQLNPHFLFNTLNNIYGLSLQHSDKAPESILKLSSIMRYMLYDTNVPQVSFEKEKEIMQAYIDMELLRLQDTGNFKFTIDADSNYSLPPLLWLPVLENTFKHGTRFIAEQYFIDFSCTIYNHKLHITSSNKYVNNNNEQGGVGLANLRKRLDILYPGKYLLNTQKQGDVYKTELTVYL